jgi:hypothetical protein
MTAPLAWSHLLNQTATYWAPGSSDGFGGVGFLPPVVIACRWQTRNVLFRSSTGEELTSNAVIYPDRELLRKGYLAEGDQSTNTDPRTVSEAREIRGATVSPSVLADRQMMKVFV